MDSYSAGISSYMTAERSPALNFKGASSAAWTVKQAAGVMWVLDRAGGRARVILVTVAGPTKTKKGVIMMAVVEHDKLKDNEPAIQSIFQTLKQTK